VPSIAGAKDVGVEILSHRKRKRMWERDSEVESKAFHSAFSQLRRLGFAT
jgi:hypothetical protein